MNKFQINIEFNNSKPDFFNYVSKVALLYDENDCAWNLEIELFETGKHRKFLIDEVSSFLCY